MERTDIQGFEELERRADAALGAISVMSQKTAAFYAEEVIGRVDPAIHVAELARRAERSYVSRGEPVPAHVRAAAAILEPRLLVVVEDRYNLLPIETIEAKRHPNPVMTHEATGKEGVYHGQSAVCLELDSSKPHERLEATVRPTENEPRTNATPPNDPSWSDVVERVRNGEPSGLEALYRVFSKGIRFYLCRQLGPQDLDEKVHDIFLIIAQGIQNGDLREPDRLMGYVRTVVRRQVASHIDKVMQARRNQTDLGHDMKLSDQPSSERCVMDGEIVDLAMRMLNSLHKREREVIMRSWLDGQSPKQICSETGLTETQVRLIKSRAMARFGELGKRRLALRAGRHLA